MTKQSDNPPIPEDHPIQKIWEDNKKTHVDLAREGDRDAIKIVLRQMKHHVYMSEKEWEAGCYVVQSGEHYRIPKETMDYLLDVFSKISDDRLSPDEAFRWKQSGGRRGPKSSHIKRDKEVRIANRAADVIELLGDETEAFYQVGEEFHIDDSTVKRAYRKYFPESKNN